MTTTRTSWIRRRAAGAALAAVLVAVMTGCATGTDSAAAPVSPSVVSSGAPPMPVVLRVGDHAVAATLIDTPASRQFAAMLPLSLQMRDVWGQAKSGPLPQMLTVEGSTPVHDPTPGDLYYGPRSGVIAVYYDDLGQAVPDPGLVRLGVVDAGLGGLANAGRRFTVWIDQAPAANP